MRPSRARRASITSGTTTAASAISAVNGVKSLSPNATTMPKIAAAVPTSATMPESLRWKAKTRKVPAESASTPPAMRSRPIVTSSTESNGIANTTATRRSTAHTRTMSGSPMIPTPRWSPTHSHIT